jgi:hypothetical protein
MFKYFKISYIKVLLICDWLISMQLIPNSSAKICNHSAIFCNYSAIFGNTMNQSKLSKVLAGEILKYSFFKTNIGAFSGAKRLPHL